MKKNLVKAFALILLAGFVACNDDDPTPQGYGDAYIVSKVDVGDGATEPVVVYGLLIEAYAIYGNLTSVKVTAGGTEYPLEKDGNVFFYESSYSTTKPASGNYTFNYGFAAGETYQTIDTQTSDALLPAENVSASYTSEQVKLEWDEVDDADALSFYLKNSEGDVVYSSVYNGYGYIEGDKTEFTITKSSGYWDTSKLHSGETYTVEVNAYLVNSTTGMIQARSTGTTTVVWGSSN